MGSIIKKIKNFFIDFPNTYTTDLERFILKHYPQNVADIEKLMFDYHCKRDTVWLS